MNSTSSSSSRNEIDFSGSGAEYFRIWIVNLALSIITLGIYSAWAKVRRLQYFYRNTTLMGYGFDYHGRPLAILKGRVIGIGLLVLYNVVVGINPIAGLTIFIVLVAVLPWLLVQSLRFKLYNSSYRGLRFRFNGTTGGAYKAFLMWPVLAYLSGGLLGPLAYQRFKSFQHNNSAFGTEPFSLDARPAKFYRLFLKLLGLFVVLVLVFIGIGLSQGVFAGLERVSETEAPPPEMAAFLIWFMVSYLAIFIVIGAWFSARMQNLVWSHTSLGPYSFNSSVRARDLLMIYITNLLGIVCTLGLFKPFADIRLARYRLSHIALEADDSLDSFIVHEQQAVSAVGEETADLFDVDISF